MPLFAVAKRAAVACLVTAALAQAAHAAAACTGAARHLATLIKRHWPSSDENVPGATGDMIGTFLHKSPSGFIPGIVRFKLKAYSRQARSRKRAPGPKPLAEIACALAAFVIMFSTAGAAPSTPSPEDRYIATRDTAIKKLSPLYDAGALDDAATRAEAAAFADLLAQMVAILKEPARKGFGAAKLNIETFYKGDEGFGTLDGLRFDAELGKTGEKAGGNGADGKYVEPRAHIIVTTQTLFERWLRAHKDWWDKGIKNVPQQIGSALKDESFYTQAISSGSAVVNFNPLPMAKPASATFSYGMLAGQTQSEIPDAADQVFVSALADGKAYVAYGSIDPEVRIPECIAIRTGYNKRSETAEDDFRFQKIDKKTYDRLGNLRQQGEDAFRRCFTRRAPQQPSFAEATRQAQALLAAAMDK